MHYIFTVFIIDFYTDSKIMEINVIFFSKTTRIPARFFLFDVIL
jgi:hypothetical protein